MKFEPCDFIGGRGGDGCLTRGPVNARQVSYCSVLPSDTAEADSPSAKQILQGRAGSL